MATAVNNLATTPATTATTPSSTTGTTTNTTTNNSSGLNANSVLDKDAFLRLLLIEMQHQDPTEPMDSDKMLTQTSQLAALEMQQNTNTTMEKMVETMNILSDAMLSSGSLTVLSAIGRTAVITDNTFQLNSASDSITAKMYLKDETKDGATFQVLDSSGNVVRSIKVDKDKLKAGTNEITWDGKDDSGKFVGAGKYTMKTTYTNADGGTSSSAYGAYPIESIKFIDGVANAQIAGQYVTFDKINEIS